MKINLSNIIFLAYYYFITKNKLTIKIKDTFLSSLIYTFIHLYIIHTNLRICNSRPPIKVCIRIKKYRQNVPQFSNSLIAHDRDYEKQDFSIWKGRKKISIGPWTRIRCRCHQICVILLHRGTEWYRKNESVLLPRPGVSLYAVLS